MARRIKRFFIFLFFSLFFSLLSGRLTVSDKVDKKATSVSGEKTPKTTVWSINSARAEGNGGKDPYACSPPAG